VSKIVTEILSTDAHTGMNFTKDTRDLLIECCVEFITMISSEANEIAEKEAKKTIACEHVQQALETLGFKDYVKDILDVAQDHKKLQAVSAHQSTRSSVPTLMPRPRQHREKKQSKIQQSGLSEEELARQQEELFRSATDKFNQAPHE
jgi:down-regulator of transcription 1